MDTQIRMLFDDARDAKGTFSRYVLQEALTSMNGGCGKKSIQGGFHGFWFQQVEGACYKQMIIPV